MQRFQEFPYKMYEQLHIQIYSEYVLKKCVDPTAAAICESLFDYISK